MAEVEALNRIGLKKWTIYYIKFNKNTNKAKLNELTGLKSLIKKKMNQNGWVWEEKQRMRKFKKSTWRITTRNKHWKNLKERRSRWLWKNGFRCLQKLLRINKKNWSDELQGSQDLITKYKMMLMRKRKFFSCYEDEEFFSCIGENEESDYQE